MQAAALSIAARFEAYRLALEEMHSGIGSRLKPPMFVQPHREEKNHRVARRNLLDSWVEEEISMNILKNRLLTGKILVVLATMLVATGCSSSSLPQGAIANAGHYNIRPR